MVDSLQTMSLRNDQAKAQLEFMADKETREVNDKHKAEMQHLIELHEQQKADLDKAYEITLSQDMDGHDKHLAELRDSNAKMLDSEKEKGEQETEKIRTRYQEQMARYRENAEKILTDLQKQTDATAANIKHVRERSKA